MRPLCALAAMLLAVCVGCGARRDHNAPARLAAQNAAEAQPEKQAGPGAKEPQRKIIYTATIRLIVEDFGKAKDELSDLLKAHGAYVVSSDVTGAPGVPRVGEWKLRVPVERFEPFQTAVTKLGELQKTNIDSQDVTDEFYDVEARIRNLEKEEGSL